MVSPSASVFAPLSEESGVVVSSVAGLVSAGALIVVVVMSAFPLAVPVPVPLSGLSPLHAVRVRKSIVIVVIIKAFFIFRSPCILILVCFLFVIIPLYFENIAFWGVGKICFLFF